MTPEQKKALEDASHCAITADFILKLPVPQWNRNGLIMLSIAQWAAESGWGEHQPGNNPFGIKAVPGEPFTTKTTREFINGEEKVVEQRFTFYENVTCAFVAHSKLLTSGTYFRPAWSLFLKTGEFYPWVTNVANRYATAPHYAGLLQAILHMPELDAIRSRL